MKLAVVNAIATLAREAPSEVVARAYGGDVPLYGKNSLIPSPFDPRLILRIAPAVARAAMESGVAKKPIEDFDAYQEKLERTVFRSGFIMKPLMAAAKANPKRVIYSDGEDERVLRAVQSVVEEGIARPTLIGRRAVVEKRLVQFGLSLAIDRDFALIDPENDPRYNDYVDTLLAVAGRHGINPNTARTLVRTNNTVIGALAVKRGEADALLCGLGGKFSVAAALRQGHHRPRAGRQRLFGGEPDDHQQGRLLHRRHPCAPRPHGGGNRRNRPALRRPCAAFRPEAENRPRLAFGFRHGRLRPRRSRCARR